MTEELSEQVFKDWLAIQPDEEMVWQNIDHDILTSKHCALERCFNIRMIGFSTYIEHQTHNINMLPGWMITVARATCTTQQTLGQLKEILNVE